MSTSPVELLDHPSAEALAGGAQGPAALRPLTEVVLQALDEGAALRGGPLPPGGPQRLDARVRAACAPVLPTRGSGAEQALRTLVRLVTEGAADPADPHCVAHLHCPPLAVSAAADLAASVLNPSMDSWDQAPAAGVVEELTTEALAELIYPDRDAPDAVITSGGTESNLVALLLARERARAGGARAVQVVCGENAHHSVHRAAWTLGLPAPLIVDCRAGALDTDALDRVLAQTTGSSMPVLVVATAGTTDEGLIDPLPQIAQIVRARGAELHVDAAYGGPLLFSPRLAPRLAGLGAAHSVTFDLHKLGWQPVAAGVLAVADARDLAHLSYRADYLNADDDTEAGLPDLLGRSLRTSRRPDALKIAVTLRALGRDGMGGLVERCLETAGALAEAVDAHPALRRRPGEVGLSTVLFRPIAADALPAAEGDALVAAVRRRLLHDGRAVLGRAVAEDADGRRRLWLKVTLLHPWVQPADLEGLLKLVATCAEQPDPEQPDLERPAAERPGQPDPSQPDSGQPAPSQPDPSLTAPGQPDSRQPDSRQPDSRQPDSAPVPPDPVYPDPVEPGRRVAR